MAKLGSRLVPNYSLRLWQLPYKLNIINDRKKDLASRELELLKTPVGGIFASMGPNYWGMIFGRDSLEVADDLLGTKPDIVLGVIDVLSYFQGLENDKNPKSGVQAGKIMHQHGQTTYNGITVSDKTVLLIKSLSDKWGGAEDRFTNYDSLDSTPLFVRLISRYGLRYGPDFLEKEVLHESGIALTRRRYLQESINWIVKHLELSSIGLLEFKRMHKDSIIIQNWRDSGSSFVHIDGKQANINEYIAPLDVQGYAYDALVMTARMYEKYQLSSQVEIDRLRNIASTLRENIFSKFWVEETQSFIMGLDRDSDHNPRKIITPSSSQGALLDSRLFNDLNDQLRNKYVGGIVKNVYNENFVTDVGIRCRSKEYAQLTGFADYHGSWAVWAKESYDFAKGLKRQGFKMLADDMAKRIINAVNISGANYELWYVHPLTGEVDYFPKQITKDMHIDPDRIIQTTTLPEEGQAWTISAVLAIKNGESPRNVLQNNRWSIKIEKEILNEVGKCNILMSKRAINKFRISQPVFAIDIESGIEYDKRWNPEWWTTAN